LEQKSNVSVARIEEMTFLSLDWILAILSLSSHPPVLGFGNPADPTRWGLAQLPDQKSLCLAWLKIV